MHDDELCILSIRSGSVLDHIIFRFEADTERLFEIINLFLGCLLLGRTLLLSLLLCFCTGSATAPARYHCTGGRTVGCSLSGIIACYFTYHRSRDCPFGCSFHPRTLGCALCLLYLLLGLLLLLRALFLQFERIAAGIVSGPAVTLRLIH